MFTSLNGQSAIVTGASKGIGLGIARALAASGAQVTLVARHLPALESARERILAQLPDAKLRIASCDVADWGSVKAMVDEAAAAQRGLSILCANAGIYPQTPMETMDPGEWDRVMAVNLRAPLAMTQAVLPTMRAQGGGAIVNLASPAGFHAVQNLASYSISKAGMVMLTKCTAKEYAAEGIRCNAIAPGVTQTPILDALPQPHLDAICAAIPQQRVARPEEIAAMAVFLASDQASYVNGSIHFVDGAAGA